MPLDTLLSSRAGLMLMLTKSWLTCIRYLVCLPRQHTEIFVSALLHTCALMESDFLSEGIRDVVNTS